MTDRDAHWMRYALQLAEQAEQQGEVPVGAVVVLGDEIIGEGYNRPIGHHDPSAHAEIIALRNAAERLGNYRLPEASLYVTLEPCLMCAGAMVHARIRQLIYGAHDHRAGAITTQMQLLDQPFLNHRVSHYGGVMAEECGELLTRFFRARR